MSDIIDKQIRMATINAIGVDTLHDHYTYEILHEQQKILLKWDAKNIPLNQLMSNEHSMSCDPEIYYFNGMWIDIIKSVFEWENGIEFGISMYHYVQFGTLVIYKLKNIGFKYYNFKIDEDGYFCVKPFRDSIRQDNYVRCNCLYNDLLDDENKPYILK